MLDATKDGSWQTPASTRAKAGKQQTWQLLVSYRVKHLCTLTQELSETQQDRSPSSTQPGHPQAHQRVCQPLTGSSTSLEQHMGTVAGRNSTLGHLRHRSLPGAFPRAVPTAPQPHVQATPSPISDQEQLSRSPFGISG